MMPQLNLFLVFGLCAFSACLGAFLMALIAVANDDFDSRP